MESIIEIEPLPCAHWCRICPDIQKELNVDDPCEHCHDCNWKLAAAEDATWD